MKRVAHGEPIKKIRLTGLPVSLFFFRFLALTFMLFLPVDTPNRALIYSL
jgi:hypothetical protein